MLFFRFSFALSCCAFAMSAHAQQLPPQKPIAEMGQPAFVQGAAISAVALSPDGKIIAVAGGTFMPTKTEVVHQIILWEKVTGKQLRTLIGGKAFAGGKAKEAAPERLVFSTDGKQLSDGRRIWNVATGKTVGPVPKKNVPVWLKLVVPTEWGTSDQSIRVWNVSGGKQSLHLPVQKKSVRCASFSPDGKELLSATGHYQPGGAIQIWNATTGKPIREIPLPKDQILTPFAFSPDGKTLALEGRATKRDKRKGGGFVVYTEYKIHLWDLTTGKKRRSLPGQEDVIWAATFSRDSKMIAWMGMDNVLWVADTATGRILRRLQTHPGGARPDTQATLAFSPDGKMLAAVGSSAAVRVWDLTTGKETHPSSTTHYYTVNDVVYTPDGQTVASASSDHTIRFWDSKSGTHRRVLAGHNRPVRRLAISPNGRKIASASQDSVICIWDVSSGKRLHKIQAVKRTAGIYSGIAPLLFTRDNEKLLSLGDDQHLQMWDVAMGKVISSQPIHLRTLAPPAKVRPQKFPPFDKQIFAAEFSPDGRYLALGLNNIIYVVGSSVTRCEKKGTGTINAQHPSGRSG